MGYDPAGEPEHMATQRPEVRVHGVGVGPDNQQFSAIRPTGPFGTYRHVYSTRSAFDGFVEALSR